MVEKFRIMNVGRGPVSFRIYTLTSHEDLVGLPNHKRRKAIKSNFVDVVVQPANSMDLVEKTGLTTAQLKKQPELLQLLATDPHKVIVLEDSSILKEKVTVIPSPEPEPIIEPEEDPDPAPEPEAAKPKKRGRPKGSKSTKKKTAKKATTKSAKKASK